MTCDCTHQVSLPSSLQGQAYRQWGKPVEALTMLNRALEYDPTYAHALHVRGMLHFGLGEHAKALVDLDKAAKLEPTNLETLVVRPPPALSALYSA